MPTTPVDKTPNKSHQRQSTLLDHGDEAASSGTKIASAASRPESTERLAAVSRDSVQPLAKLCPSQ